jgi:hypothetical protein
MALPSSGPLTLANIQTEFGGSNPISLNEYYAGGGLVPAGTSGTYGAVPSSGTISIRNFYGTSNIVIQLTTPRTISYTSGGILSAQAGYGLDPDSYVYTAANFSGSYTQSEQWDSVPATTGNYQVRATLNSGSTPTGSALSTWLTVSSFRSWLLNASPGNFLTCNLTIEVRDTATSTVRATASVTLRADAT